MSKNLKLVGLISYTGPATTKNGVSVVVKRGEICRFSDEIADKVSEGFRINREGQEVLYFEEAGENEKVQHNFTEDKVEIEPSEVNALTGRNTREKATPQRSRQRQRLTTA